jgi:hypothetical protein
MTDTDVRLTALEDNVAKIASTLNDKFDQLATLLKSSSTSANADVGTKSSNDGDTTVNKRSSTFGSVFGPSLQSTFLKVGGGSGASRYSTMFGTSADGGKSNSVDCGKQSSSMFLHGMTQDTDDHSVGQSALHRTLVGVADIFADVTADVNDGQRPQLPTAHYTMRSVPEFKRGHDIRGWLIRVREYCVGTGITQPARIAQVMLSALHDDVHTPLRNLNYPAEVYRDPVALAAMLTMNYGDYRSAAEHGIEFRSMRQKDKESASDFFDRAYASATRAHPSHALMGPERPEMYDLLATRFVDGLRNASLRRNLYHNMPKNLFELKLRAQELESIESAVYPKLDTTSSSNVKSTSIKTEDGETATKNQDSTKSKRNRTSIHSHVSDSNSKSSNEMTCYNCHQPGHIARNCTRNKNTKSAPVSNVVTEQSVTRTFSICERCGRRGHSATKCWQQVHVNGAQLADNGLRPTGVSAKPSNATASAPTNNAKKSQNHVASSNFGSKTENLQAGCL